MEDNKQDEIEKLSQRMNQQNETEFVEYENVKETVQEGNVNEDVEYANENVWEKTQLDTFVVLVRI